MFVTQTITGNCYNSMNLKSKKYIIYGSRWRNLNRTPDLHSVQGALNHLSYPSVVRPEHRLSYNLLHHILRGLISRLERMCVN